MMQRRGFLGAILAAGFAPAAISSGVLMPVRQIVLPSILIESVGLWPLNIDVITREALAILEKQLVLTDSLTREFQVESWSPTVMAVNIRKPRRYVQRIGA